MARRPRPPGSASTPRRKAGEPRRGTQAGSNATRRALGIAALVLVLGGAAIGFWTRAGRLRAGAEAASRAADWPRALEAWRAVNATSGATGATLVAEARAALALGRAAEAEQALRRAGRVEPANPESWRLLLEILRVEDRPLDALAVGREALDAVPARGLRSILKGLTLALLADLPDDLARKTLARWAGAPADLDARAALLKRFAAMPRPGDPPRADRIGELHEILNISKNHLDAREALANALADAGEPDAGRRVLDDWPGEEGSRDARYWRLRGRWDLEYDHRPGRAVGAFERALADLPHDWKTRVRLARALHALDREDDARREAEAVGRVREVLDPARLGPRLSADLDRPDHPAASQADLADLCARAGLARLAEAWRTLPVAEPDALPR